MRAIPLIVGGPGPAIPVPGWPRKNLIF